MFLPLVAVLSAVTALLATEPAPELIQDTDWKNFSYPLLESDGVPGEVRWMAQGRTETASLINGLYVVRKECDDAGPLCPLMTFDSVKYGSLFGVSTTAAAVV